MSREPRLNAKAGTDTTHRKLLRQAYDDALEELVTKNIAAIIDAFGFTEYELDSALARADQTAYEVLFEGAQKSEMNHMQYMWPMIVDTRRMWKRIEEENGVVGVKAKL